MKIKKIKKHLSLILAAGMLVTGFTCAPAALADTETDQGAAYRAEVQEEAGQAAAALDAAGKSGQAEPEKEPEQINVTEQEQSGEVTESGEESTSFAVNVQSGEGGKITADKTSVSSGEKVHVKVSPSSGYKIKNFYFNDMLVNVEYNDRLSGYEASFTASKEMTFRAEFEKITKFTIDTSVNYSSRGTITADSKVDENGTKTIKVTPKSGFYLADLLIDGKSVGAKESYTFKNISKNHTAKGVFKEQVKIMLDPGHYGSYYNKGAYPGYWESNMTWQLYLYLRDELENYDGFKIGTTRAAKAIDRDVYYRGTASSGYDLFLSLHSNAAGASADYPLIIKQKKNGVPAKLTTPLGKAIENTIGTKQSARTITKTNSDGKTEYYGVLRGSAAVGTPGLILEHSFHTNYRAAKWLYQNSNLKLLAKAETKVLADYYQIEKTGNGSSADKPPASFDYETVPSTEIVKITKAVNIRTEPSNGADKIKTAKIGDVYQLQAKTKDGNWGQIKASGYWFYLKGYTAPASEEDLYGIISASDKVEVLVSDLNMREKPDTSAKIKGVAQKNAVYQLKAKTKDGCWGQIKSSGYWIYIKGYTQKVTAENSSDAAVISTAERVKVTVGSLTMRAGHSTSTVKMGTAQKNKIYQLKAKTKDGNWGQIESNGYWIYLKGYTVKVTSGESSAVVSTNMKVKVMVGSLTFRASHSTSAKKMGTAKRDAVYQLKAKTKDGKWGQIKSNGYWIYLEGYTKAM